MDLIIGRYNFMNFESDKGINPYSRLEECVKKVNEQLTDVSITLKMHLTGTAYGTDAITVIIALLTAITGSKLRKRKDGLISMKIKSKNLVSEASYFGDMVINELFFKKKEISPSDAIQTAIKNLNRQLGGYDVIKKATKVDPKLEGQKQYDNFVNGDLKKIRIAEISIKKLLEYGDMDFNTGIFISDKKDCWEVINSFGNRLFNKYTKFCPDGYHAKLEKTNDFGYIVFCKGGDSN